MLDEQQLFFLSFNTMNKKFFTYIIVLSVLNAELKGRL